MFLLNFDIKQQLIFYKRWIKTTEHAKSKIISKNSKVFDKRNIQNEIEENQFTCQC